MLSVDLKPGMVVCVNATYLQIHLDPVRLIERVGRDQYGERWECEVEDGEYKGRRFQYWINWGSLLWQEDRWEPFALKDKVPF